MHGVWSRLGIFTSQFLAFSFYCRTFEKLFHWRRSPWQFRMVRNFEGVLSILQIGKMRFGTGGFWRIIFLRCRELEIDSFSWHLLSAAAHDECFLVFVVSFYVHVNADWSTHDEAKICSNDSIRQVCESLQGIHTCTQVPVKAGQL